METKKLSCCDLMIGDWVEVNGNCIQVENVYKDMINYTPDIPYVQEEYFIEEKDITPIPLTAEILEKNGFVKHRDIRDIFYRFAVHIDEYNGFMFTLGRDFDGVFCLQSNRFVRFAYVHELQHALRLCGVDKEITL